MQNNHLLSHVKLGGRTFSVLVTLLVTAMTLLPQSVWGQTEYGLTVGGVVVTSENAGNITGGNILGTVSFDVQTSALTLNGATITGNIVITDLTSLTINVVGKNTINAGASSALQSNVATTACALTFQRGSDLDCSLALNSEGVTVISTGFSTPEYQALGLVVDGLDENYDPDYYPQRGLAYYDSNTQSYPAITSATITSYTTYDIIVNGEAVTNLNKNKIRKGAVGVGHITFDGEHTLTLNNVPNVVFDGQYPFIQTSMDLTIHLVGNNAFDCGQNVFITRMPGDNDTHTVKFTTDANNPGLLALTVGDQFDGFDKAFENNLQWCPDGYYDSQATYGPVAWVAIPYTEYGITVGGVAVTSANAGSITGDNIVAYSAGEPYSVSYDATSNTLTLTNAIVSSGGIVSTGDAGLNVSLNGSAVNGSSTVDAISCAGDLSISAIGSNFINNPIVSTKDGGATLTLQHGSDADAALTLNSQSGEESGFTAVVYDGLYLTTDNARTLKFSPSRQRFEESADAWATTINFSSAKTYELWLGATKVTEANKANILGTEEPTATFDSDENILTLDGMTLTGTGIENDGIISRLPNLTISVNGANMITCKDSCSVIRADLEGAQSLSIQKGSDGCSLTLDGSRVIRDFKTLTVTGLSWNDNNFTYQYDTSLPNFNNGYRLMKADGEEASKNYDTGFKPALYDESVETYDLWVAGVQVTSANADDITASAIVEGKISFDAAKNVLTFERATIDLENVYMGIPVASGIAALTVNLVGDNTITPNINNPFFAKYTGEAGAAPTLTFDTEGFMDDGIYWLGSLTLNNLEEIGSVANGYEFDLEESPENVYPQDAGSATTGWKYSVGTTNSYVRIWKFEVFDLWIGDGRVISSDIRGGKDNAPYYNPVTDRLVCYDNCEYPIISSMAALTVEIDGECTIAPTTSSPAISFQERGDVTSGTLTFVRADDAQSVSITLTANGENNSSEPYKAIEGFSAANITVGEGLFLKSHATMAEALEATTVTIGDPTGYALYIGDTQVTDVNADDVLGDGKVSFTVNGGQEAAPTYTLTLNGAALTAPVKVGLANLTFDIRGNNTITTNTTCIQNTAATGVPSLTFKSTSDEVGSLILTNTDEDYTGVISESYYGHFTISEELALIMLRYGNYTSNTYYFSAGEVHNAQLVPSYGVQVGEMQVYAGNAADVLGDGTISFNKENNTLTLNGANTGALCTSLEELTVELIDNNTLSAGGSYPVLRSLSGENVTVNVQSTAAVKGTLTMNMPYTQAGNFCEDQVTLNIVAPLEVVSGSLTGNDDNNNTVVIGPNYGITITTAGGSYPITSDNRTNVLGDQGAEPTVQFDGKNTLFLNNANLNGEIIVNSSAFVDEPLTICLKGTNTINNRTYLVQNALASGNIKVNFATNELKPGSLTYTTPEILKEPISAFVGCNVLYLNGLVPTLSEGANSGSVLSISMSLQPIVNHSGEEKTLDGEGDGLGEDIETKTTDELTAGVVENGILYTLPDADDGYESPGESGSGKVVAINSTMTEEEINTIAGQVANGTLVPGMPEFAAAFKGMTFLLPAGTGIIIINVRTNESGKLVVKIGNQPAVTFDEAKTAFGELVVPFACSEPTFVSLSNRGGGADRMEYGSRRAPGRKETATVEIKGLSVSASSVVAVPEPALSPVLLDKSAVAKVAGKHFIKVNNPDVAGVDAYAFEDVKEDDELTYVDLTKTGIKGITVDRSTDAFQNVPEKAFIYLPAGNKVKAGTKNVIIGSVCENMEMADDAPYFEMAQDFTALQVKQNRDYKDFVGKNCTVYLPFAIDAETAASLGTFYELKGYDGTTVSMESVTETKANTPYMFKPKAADTEVAAKMVTVKAAPTPAEAPVAGNAVKIKFVGTYEKKNIVSEGNSTQYYCFMAGAEAGKFVRVKTNPVTMNPYRAYMVVEGAAARELDLVIDGVSTGIKNMKVGTDDNVYYDLQGRRVLYPTKGLYIVNGRKVIIK